MASTVGDEGEPGIHVDSVHEASWESRWMQGPPTGPEAGMTGRAGPPPDGWPWQPPQQPPPEPPRSSLRPWPPVPPPSAPWPPAPQAPRTPPPGASRVLPPPPPPGEWAHPFWPSNGAASAPFTDPPYEAAAVPVPRQFAGPHTPPYGHVPRVDLLPRPDQTSDRLPAVPDTGPQVIEPSVPLPLPASTGPQPGIVETGPLDVVPLTHLGGSAVGRRAAPPAFRPTARRRSGGGVRRRSEPAVVSVDNNRCHLYAICQQEAPASFLVSRDGRLYYDAAPPEHLMASVRQAARLCPMQAITLGNDSR
ncbi:ferredoxin [Frankia sp. AgB1.8]|nr:ferredoxin [Frankia sp. AgB1.8]